LKTNMLGMGSKSFLGVVAKAKMLGLPVKEIELLRNVLEGASGLSGSKIKIAGDHTDIDALLKMDLKNYKKDFTRINIISHKLNTAKLAADHKLIALVKDFNKINNPNASQIEKFNQKVQEIRTKFTNETKVPISNPQIKGGKIVLDFQTPRLIDLKNPIWTTLNKATTNLMEQSGLEVTSFDDKLRKITSVKERFNLLKNAGLEQLNKSKILRGFAKIKGPVGNAAKLLLAGTITTTALTTLAQAEEIEPSDEKQEAGVTSVISEHPILSSAAAVTGAAPKKTWEAVKWAGRKLLPIMTPAVSHAFKLWEGKPYNPTSGHDTTTMAFWKHTIDAMGKTSKLGDANVSLIKRLKDLAWRGGLPTRFLPIISGGAAVAAGPMLIKDAAAWLQKKIDEEGLTGKIEEQSFIGDEAGAGYLMEEAYDKKRKEDAEGMDYAQGGLSGVDQYILNRYK